MTVIRQRCCGMSTEEFGSCGWCCRIAQIGRSSRGRRLVAQGCCRQVCTNKTEKVAVDWEEKPGERMRAFAIAESEFPEGPFKLRSQLFFDERLISLRCCRDLMPIVDDEEWPLDPSLFLSVDELSFSLLILSQAPAHRRDEGRESQNLTASRL